MAGERFGGVGQIGHELRDEELDRSHDEEGSVNSATGCDRRQWHGAESAPAMGAPDCGTLSRVLPPDPYLSPYELFVGLRYTRAKRRNRFISVISLISAIGITIGVAALIVVLSVMNGFQKELRTRILGVASHIQIAAFDGGLRDWRDVAQQASRLPDVVAAAPFINQQGLLGYGRNVQGALIRGILPQEEDQVADIGRHMKLGALGDLRPGAFGIVLGSELAHAVGERRREGGADRRRDR
jgi:hypothetical protein